MKTVDRIILIAILTLGTILRLYGLNWDQGFHLHPDERAIVLSVVALTFPTSPESFFIPASTWNPHFFAYGSFPFYLLRITGDIAGLFHAPFAEYDKINLVGRLLSALFDIATVFVLYVLTKKIFTEKVALLAAFFYATSVLPIQLSHFYAVDTLLTFFIMLTLYNAIRFYEHKTTKKALAIAVCFGFALATKISATVLLTAIGLTLTIDFLLLWVRQPHKPHIWLPHLPPFIKHLLTNIFLISLISLTTFIVLEPYAIIDWPTFINQTREQSHMTKSAFTFPYTLQYVGKIPYLYELKNIFLWGQGPILALLSFFGAIYFTHHAVTKDKKDKWAKETIIATFFWTYLLIVGSFTIGFMRYMLPLYPLLCLFAAAFAFRIHHLLVKNMNSVLLTTCYVLLTTCLLAWPLSFIRIYSQPNTRVLASKYINQSILPNQKLAIEHWDDSLPMWGQEKYTMLSLPLYESDTDQKWLGINQQLNQTDYLIIASNRLYTPLMKLTNCEILPVGKCYTQTAEYYSRLFKKELGFTKIAEFASYPTIPVFNIPINDQSADESFTVYDHPKIMIFKNDRK